MAGKTMAAARHPAAAWLWLLPALLAPMASATGSLRGSVVNESGVLPAHVNGTLPGDERLQAQIWGVRRRRQSRPSKHALFVIGSNNLEQTARRIGVDVEALTARPAVLKNYQREFRGLAKGRSYGAVATPIRREGKELRGVLVFLPTKVTKAVESHRGETIGRPGDDTLGVMDIWEGAGHQYFRTKRRVTHYDPDLSNPAEVDAHVYIMKEARRFIVGTQSTPYRESLRTKRWPYREYNNGMVSKVYIDAVLKMLLEAWGRDKVDAARDFPPARNTRICIAGSGRSSCRRAYTVVMFDDAKCQNQGAVDKYGQRRGACARSATDDGMFAPHVPKYSVNAYVPDRRLEDMESAVAGPPGSR